MNNAPLPDLLMKSAKLHRHLCPRQVLGVRMGLAAGELLEIELPQKHKQLFTIVETDGCAADGISVATNCWVGRRTLWVMDYGKVAATFVNSRTGETIRIVPHRECRQQAVQYANQAANRWEAQLSGYQSMPIDELFYIQTVKLRKQLEDWISKPGKKALCDGCGEEIINGREIYHKEMILCLACTGEAYYHQPVIDSCLVQAEAHIQEVNER